MMIVDTSATKPEDWLENEPETIPDPEAEKPEEWDVSGLPKNSVAQLTDRMRRMETGSHPWSPTLNVKMVPDVDHGPPPRSETQSTRVNGLSPKSPTQTTRVNGLLDRFPTPPSLRTALHLISQRLPVLELSFGP